MKKKILSIFLSATLLVTCLLTVPFTTSAAVNITWQDGDTLFATKDAKGDTTPWLGVDSNCGESTTVSAGQLTIGGSFRHNLVNGAYDFLSQPILDFNDENGDTGLKTATATSVQNFVWDFKMGSTGNTKTKTNAVEAYFFHVNENSDYDAILNWSGSGGDAGLSSIKDCFAIIYSRAGSTDGLKAEAFTVLQPTYDADGSSLGLRPISYTTGTDGEIIPDASSYYEIGDNINNENSRKITITLKENELTLKWEQKTSLDSWYKGDDREFTKSFVLSPDSLAKAPSGDFVLSHTKSSSNSGTAGNICGFGAMTITELAYDTNDEFDKTGLLFNSTGETDWLGANTATAADATIKYVENTNNTYQLYGGITTTNILAQNGVPSDIINGIKNFVWEFDLCFYSKSDANLAFLFHVNDNSVTNTTKTSQITNALGVVINGSLAARQSSSYPNSIRISSTGSNTGLYLSKGLSVTDDDGTYQEIVSGTVAKDIAVDVTYKVRIAYKDGAIQVVFYDPANKAETYTSAYYEYTTAQIGNATAGDFAIVSNWSRNYISNMKIWTGDEACQWDIDGEYTEDYYKTEYTFASDTEGLINVNTTGDLTWESGALKLACDANSNSDPVRITNLDSSNDNLGDFIMKFDWSWSGSHGWTTDNFAFRIQDDSNLYRMQINRDSATLDADHPGYSIKIFKRVDGTDTELATANLAKSLTKEKVYTIVLKVVDNSFEVYFAPQGAIYNEQPILYTEDDAYKTGSTYYNHLNGDVYLDNITVYDLTAKALAEEAAPLIEEPTLANRDAIYALYDEYSALNDAQIEKLDTYYKSLLAARDTADMLIYNVNGEGEIDICDLVALKIIIGSENSSTDNDINADGTMSANDLSVLRYVLLDRNSTVTVGSGETSVGTLRTAFNLVKDGGTVSIDGTYAPKSCNELYTMGKKVTVTGGTIDLFAFDTVDFYGDITLENVTVNFKNSSYVYANGNSVTIAQTATVNGEPTAIYGGSNGHKLESTDLTLMSGTYGLIFGGSKGSTITGSTKLTVGGNTNSTIDATDHNGTKKIFGGSDAGVVKSDTNLYLTGGKAHYVYGGSNENSTVEGTCNVNYSGMSAMSIYGGGFHGTVYKTNVNVTGGWCEQIFGGSTYNSVVGSTEVNITGGEIERRIYGGCYNNYKILEGYTAEYYVSGTATVRLGGSVDYKGTHSDGDNYISAGSRYDNPVGETSKLYFETQYLYDSLKSHIGGTTDYGYDELYIANEKQQ